MPDRPPSADDLAGTGSGGHRRRSVTLRDVARAAGVHPSTVSRVLSEDTRQLVNVETARLVDGVIRELGYEPNPLARGLKTRRSLTVGVLINDLTNPVFPPIVRGIEDRLAEAGYTALLVNTDGDRERERRSYGTLTARQVDGFIMATAVREHPLIEEVLADEIPLVLVIRNIDSRRATAVVPDDRKGARLAVQYLFDLGHRRIAHLAGPLSVSNGAERRAGFIDALRANGLEVDPGLIVSADAFTSEAGERAAHQLLESQLEFTAIVAGNDMIAVGCAAALGEHGLSCPDDVSVVGFNDMPLADRLSPPLTSLRVPHYEIGVQAADLLLERIKDPATPPREILVEPQLIVRGSARGPRSAPIPDPTSGTKGISSSTAARS